MAVTVLEAGVEEVTTVDDSAAERLAYSAIARFFKCAAIVLTAKKGRHQM